VPRDPEALVGGPAPEQRIWLPPDVPPEPPEARGGLIAQCPNCGSFQINDTNRRREWRLGCRECAHEWTWQEGGPWPTVQVRPEIRGQGR